MYEGKLCLHQALLPAININHFQCKQCIVTIVLLVYAKVELSSDFAKQDFFVCNGSNQRLIL